MSEEDKKIHRPVPPPVIEGGNDWERKAHHNIPTVPIDKLLPKPPERPPQQKPADKA